IGCFGPLQDDIGPVLTYSGKKPSVEPGRFVDTHILQYVHARLAQYRYALAIDAPERIATTHHYLADALFDDQRRAGRRFSVVCAGFQIDIQRAFLKNRRRVFAISFADILYHQRLGMALSVFPMVVFSNHLALMDEHGAHHGVGTDLSRT